MLRDLVLFLLISALYTSVHGAALGKRDISRPYFPWKHQNVVIENYNDAPRLMSGSLVGPSPAGGSISSGYSYSTSFSITPTFDWTISAAAQGGGAGIFTGVSVSWTWTQGASVSISVTCPNNIECGLTASGQYVRVTGQIMTSPCYGTGTMGDDIFSPPADCAPISEDEITQWYQWNWWAQQDGHPAPPYETWSAFEADLPVIDSHASLVNGQDAAIVDWNVCFVRNPSSTGNTGSMRECPANS